MILDNKIVNGKTRITNLGDTLIRNFSIMSSSKSFPANSEIYSHTDCNKKINIKMQNVLANVFK